MTARDLPTFLAALRAEGAANRPLRECPSAYPLADYLTEIGEPTAVVWLRALRVAPPADPPGTWTGPPVSLYLDAGAGDLLIRASDGREPHAPLVTLRPLMPGGGCLSVAAVVTADELRAICRPETWAVPGDYDRYTEAAV